MTFSDDESDLDCTVRLQNALISVATGTAPQTIDRDYRAIRARLSNRADLKEKLPDFVRRCGDSAQFWGWIKYEYQKYQERRDVIWAAFRPLIDYLEAQDRTPGVAPITVALEAFDPKNVHSIWQKALDRRADDPEGAITAARTLLETVCKHILDDAGKTYASDADLPKLWAMASECLNLAPSQHQEEVFKAILGNCQSVVNYLGTIRNRIGDAHGQGRNPVKPKARHAELAVNLAGTMASFLVATWQERQP